MIPRRATPWTVAAAWVLALAPASPAASQEAGRLVIVGGSLDDDNEAVYRAVLEGRRGAGPLCVLPTASGVPQRSMESAVSDFASRAGEDAVVGVFLTVDNASDADAPGVARRLRGCSGYWFTGGAQSRVVDVFLPEGRRTAAFDAVWQRHRAGAVVAGSSAGAAIMSRDMIAGGGSDDALAHGVRSGEDGEGVWVRRGLGFLEGFVVDQHFLARGRFARLAVATLDGAGGGVGLGIDENTAVVVDGRRARVVGESGVLLVDARDARRVGAGGTGVALRLLGRGDEIDLTTWSVEISPEKAPVEGEGGAVEPPEDALARWALLDLLAALSRSADTAAEIVGDGYRLRLEEGPGFEARALGGPGVRAAPAGLSAGPWRLDLVPTG